MSLPDPPMRTFFRHLADGRFLLQRSRSSGRWIFYPRGAVPGSDDDDLEWAAPSGYGTVHSTTVMRPRPPAEPYNLAIVELDEGVRMMTRVEGVPAVDVRIGQRVRSRIVPNPDGDAMVVFDVDGQL